MNGKLPGTDSDHPLASGKAAPPRRAGNRSAWQFRAAFFVRRQRWTLTWRARVLALLILTTAVVLAIQSAYGFLAVNSPSDGQFLIVEDWMPTYAYREVAMQFHKRGYLRVIAAGIVQEDVDFYEDAPEHTGTESLLRFGVPPDAIVAVSHSGVQRDRTYHSALAVRDWLRSQKVLTASIDVITVGAHARRSRLLYEKALGSEFAVGVISVKDRRFDPQQWWASSEGVRSVIGETIGYVYARFIFSPE
jgi:hypothetical protein